MKPLFLAGAALFVASCSQPADTPAATSAGLRATDRTDYRPAQLNLVRAPAPTLREAYGEDSAVQIGELRMPAGEGPFPVAMLVHGGCWANMGSLNNFGPMAAWLTEHGVATWNVDYRELENGGGWPESFLDWAQALAHLMDLAKRYPLDLERVSVIGHSAGTTPAVWLAMGDHGDQLVAQDLPDVRASILLDGPLSLSDWVGPDAEICGKPVIAALMGGTPQDVPERFRVVEPMTNQLKVSDLLVVKGALPGPPRGMVAKIASQGVATKQVDLDGKSHFNLLVPGTPDFALIADELLRATGGK